MNCLCLCEPKKSVATNYCLWCEEVRKPCVLPGCHTTGCFKLINHPFAVLVGITHTACHFEGLFWKAVQPQFIFICGVTCNGSGLCRALLLTDGRGYVAILVLSALEPLWGHGWDHFRQQPLGSMFCFQTVATPQNLLLPPPSSSCLGSSKVPNYIYGPFPRLKNRSPFVELMDRTAINTPPPPKCRWQACRFNSPANHSIQLHLVPR